MKKLFYPAILLIATVFFFNGCADEDPAQGVSVDTFPRATIEGYAYLNINQSSTAVVKYAPEGTLLSFTIPYSGLGISGSSGNYVKTTPVKADGSYAVELPARADGTPVTVSISGAEILLKITTDDGKSVDQIFKVNPVEEPIVAGFTYRKKLEYSQKEAFQVSATWEEAIYEVELEYSDGKTNLPVPKDTEVKITVSGNSFVPTRANDWVFFKKVGFNGSLEIKMDAPSLFDGGLAFTWELAFRAEATEFIYDYVTGTEKPVSNDYKFYIKQTSTIYGGESVDAGTVSATRGAKLTNN
ncbi:MAG: hypothetical protein LBP72_05740 [Dysgonamonadaceae bacterium]|jgi:hypothetical protein|nr:hypothetical protein [Dysgonamonadaceae bacterium]